MSLPRFFLEEQVLGTLSADAFVLELSSGDERHAKALRLGRGDHIAVIDASSDYFECEIEGMEDGHIRARISSRCQHRHNIPRITLFQGLPKGDKLDQVVRQGTEIGVSRFVPVACERSVVRLDATKAVKRADRLRSVAKSAAMQSGRETIPQVDVPCAFDEACEILRSFDAVVVFWEESTGTETLSEILKAGLSPDSEVAVLVGPEGGISEGEIDLLMSSCDKAKLCSMGDNILRTETAGVVGCALVIYQLGGLGA